MKEEKQTMSNSNFETEAYLAGERALAKALATRESIAQRESYHKDGKLVLLTQAEVNLLTRAIKESNPMRWLNEDSCIQIYQLVDKLQNLS